MTDDVRSHGTWYTTIPLPAASGSYGGAHVGDTIFRICRNDLVVGVFRMREPPELPDVQDTCVGLVCGPASVSPRAVSDACGNISASVRLPDQDGFRATGLRLVDWSQGWPVATDLPVQLGIADTKQLVVHDSYKIPNWEGNGDKSCMCVFPCLHLTIISAPMQCDHFISGGVQ